MGKQGQSHSWFGIGTRLQECSNLEPMKQGASVSFPVTGTLSKENVWLCDVGPVPTQILTRAPDFFDGLIDGSMAIWSFMIGLPLLREVDGEVVFPHLYLMDLLIVLPGARLCGASDHAP
jgi:hypothetical protein